MWSKFLTKLQSIAQQYRKSISNQIHDSRLPKVTTTLSIDTLTLVQYTQCIISQNSIIRVNLMVKRPHLYFCSGTKLDNQWTISSIAFYGSNTFRVHPNCCNKPLYIKYSLVSSPAMPINVDRVPHINAIIIHHKIVWFHTLISLEIPGTSSQVVIIILLLILISKSDFSFLRSRLPVSSRSSIIQKIFWKKEKLDQLNV